MPKKGSVKRQKYSTEEFLKPGFEMPTDYNDLVSLYRTVAKAADTRLERLEKLTKEENYKIADKWAYARAMRDIEQYSGEDATRFNVKPPKTITGLTAKIEDIKTFLNAPSSTKGGIKKMYVDRAKKINEEYGTDFTWEEIGTFFEDERWKYLGGGKKQDNGKYESKTTLKAIARVKRNFSKDDLKKAIKKGSQIDLKMPDDQVTRTVRDILKSKKQSKMLLDLLYE